MKNIFYLSFVEVFSAFVVVVDVDNESFVCVFDFASASDDVDVDDDDDIMKKICWYGYFAMKLQS